MNPAVKELFDKVDPMQVKSAIEAFCKLMGIDINALAKNYLILFWDKFVDFMSNFLHLAIDYIASIDWSGVFATIGLSGFAIGAGGACGGLIGGYIGSEINENHGGLIGGVIGGSIGGAIGGGFTGGAPGGIAGAIGGGVIGGIIGHSMFDKKRSLVSVK